MFEELILNTRIRNNMCSATDTTSTSITTGSRSASSIASSATRSTSTTMTLRNVYIMCNLQVKYIRWYMIFASIHTYYMSWNLYTHHQRKHVDDPRHQPSQQGSVINTPPPRRRASESLWALGCNLESTHVKSAKLYRRVLWRIDHLQDTCLVRLVVLVVASNMAICRKDSTAEEAISSQTSHSICGRSPFLSLRKQTATSWWHILKQVCTCVGLSCKYRALYSEIVFFKYHRICMSRTSSKHGLSEQKGGNKCISLLVDHNINFENVQVRTLKNTISTCHGSDCTCLWRNRRNRCDRTRPAKLCIWFPSVVLSKECLSMSINLSDMVLYRTSTSISEFHSAMRLGAVCAGALGESDRPHATGHRQICRERVLRLNRRYPKHNLDAMHLDKTVSE